jgi:hypothetical protein
VRSRVTLAIVVVLVAVLGWAAWVALNPARGGARLGERPEASLRYPSSEELAQGHLDRVEDALGTTNAAWWMILGTNGSIEQVEEFYRHELATLGWGDGRADRRTTSELSAVDWRQGGFRLRLAFMESEEWHQRIEGSDRFTTLYEIRLIQTDSGSQRP